MKTKILILMLSFLSLNSFAESKCKEIGTIGKEGKCLNKLIVDNQLLRELVDKREDYSYKKIYTGNVTDMSSLFENDINNDIAGWDVSNVTTMQKMFEEASNFNQPLNDWVVSNVTDMREMFREASNFNQPLNKWDVSNVEIMDSIFEGTKNFNQNINDWNLRVLFEIDEEVNQEEYTKEIMIDKLGTSTIEEQNLPIIK